MTQTKFSFEVPMNHLYDFHEDQDFIFTLEHLFDTKCNPQADLYQQYTSFVHTEGLKTVWLDNGFNELEKASDPSDMIYIAHHVKPAKVISPDDPKWPIEKIINSYMEMISKTFTRDQLIPVASDMKMARNLIKQLGTPHLAISYWVRDQWDYDDLLEVKDAVFLHFLGLLNPEEIQTIRPETCDTSMPIKLALIDQHFETWCVKGCPHIHTKDLGACGQSFFETRMTDKQIMLAKENIKTLKEMTR